jgi:plasmid stability protein
MTTLTVKNIPDDLYAQLKQRAEMNHRSINSEIIVCIEKAVRSSKIDPNTFLVRARQLREKSSDYKITEDEFNQAKTTGRR